MQGRWKLLGNAGLGAIFALALGSAGTAAAAADPWITTKVKVGLLTSEGLGTATDVNVDTTDGRVTLYGTVGSEEAKAQAERVAKGTDGVREVRNLLRVSASPARERAAVSDDTLRERVDQALDDDAALEEHDIEVRSVDEGVVVLGGESRSLHDTRRALETAGRVDGVRRVVDQIQTPDESTWREEAGERANDVRSSARDMWITSATKMRLVANTETPAFDINVDTRDGVVTLFGTVDSAEAKAQAEGEARQVDGVQQVKNELQVVVPEQTAEARRTDEQLREAIDERFQNSDRLADTSIDVAVENGVARLTGSVPSSSARVTALTTARNTQGVRRVIDDLRVEQ